MAGRGRFTAIAAAMLTCTAAAAAAAGVQTPATASPAAHSPATASAAAAANSSLLGEWHMDELDPNSDGPASTPDSSGHDNYLMVANPTQVPGRFGNAFSFNAGNQDKLYTPGSGLQPAQLTTMAWVKGSTSPGTYKDILSQGGDPSCSIASYALYTGADGGLSFYIGKDTATTFNSASAKPASIWDGRWHAVAGTYDGSNVRLYVDGAEVGAPTPASGVAIDYSLPDNEFEVGNYVGCPGFEYTGGIDEVRVYDRALTGSEVGEIQSATATTPPELGADPTSTHVDCMPATASVGSAVACTATVSDTAAADATAPTGTMTFTSDGSGAFGPAAGTCTLGSPQGVTSTCSVTYTPSEIGSGSHHITAAFASDAQDTSSTGTATLTVTSTPAGAPAPTPPATASPTSPAPTTTPPQAVFSVSNSLATAAATPITLNAGATTGASTLQWSVGGKPTVSCNAATPDLTVQIAKPTLVTLTAFGPGGSATSTHVVPILAASKAPPASSAALLGTAVCSGGSPTVDVTANGGPPAGCSTNVVAGIVSAVGCLNEVTDASRVPGPEAGILVPMLSAYQASPADQALGKFYCSTIVNCSRRFNVPVLPGIHRTVPIVTTLGLYLSRQPVRINGVDFTPVGGASIAVSPGFARVVSSNALVRVGGVPIAAGKINFDVSNACTPACSSSSVQIATFDSRNLPGLSGAEFPFTGTASIAFVVHGTDRYSEITGHAELPGLLGGVTVDAKLRVDNTNGITLEDFAGYIGNVSFGGVGLTDARFVFHAPSDWGFYGNVGIGTASIMLTPTASEPYNGIVFHNGSLDHAGATVDLTADPPPIAPGVDLEKANVSFASNPTALRGSITLKALGVADVTGNLVLAFPSPSAPFKPQPFDLPGAPSKILNQTYYNGPVFGVGGSADVVIPDVGDVPLGQGYLLYAYPNYVALGGQASIGIKDVVTIDGQIDGEFNVTNRRFNLTGTVTGCVADICGTVSAVVSSYGAGICAGDFGGGVLWSDFPTPHIYGKVLGIGKACKQSRFTDDHVFDGHITGVNAPGSFVVKRGKPAPEILLTGDSGAPNVMITGPNGQVLTADGLGVHRAGGLIAVQSEVMDETILGVTDGTPGTYTITPLPGPTVIDSAHATLPAPTSVKGKVTGTGTRRTLRYTVSGLVPGERITFAEVENGISREIGSTNSGHGTLNFTTSSGPGKRSIIAQDAVNGMGIANAQNIFVAHFSGPAFVKPAAVTKLSTHWVHGALTASWKSAKNAALYKVTLREKHGGLLTLTTRKTSLRIGAAASTLSGAVKVVAVSSDGSSGPARNVSYRAAHAPTTRFLPFSQLTPKKKKG